MMLLNSLMKMRVMAISGSLRSQSTNTTTLRAAAMLAPQGMKIELSQELDRIPPLNPDLEGQNTSGPVAHFRRSLRESEAVLFSTPEYAHGIPGVLKNALDWVVGTGELSRKPVVLIHASCRGSFAIASLKEVLTTMDARLLDEAEVTIDLSGKGMTATEVAQSPDLALELAKPLGILLQLNRTPGE